MKYSFAYAKGYKHCHESKTGTGLKPTSITDKLWEKYNESIERVINIYYKIELAILTDNFVPFDFGKSLHILKAIHTTYKKTLGLPDPDEMTFPLEFIEEYTDLLRRTDLAIGSVKKRIEKLNSFQNTEPIKTVLEKNLFILDMLRLHYICALELD